MGFFNVLGLISLIAVPAVIILHMLKRKQKDVRIPSTFLWERAADTSVQSKPWQKLKKSIPLILQIVALTSLGLAASRPYISAFGKAYNYVVVIDASASMSAEDMGQTRLEYAKERAEKLIKSASAMSNITVITACDNPYIAYGPGNDKGEALSVVKSVRQTYGGIDKDTLNGIIASEAAKTSAGVYIFTDDKNCVDELDANIFYAGKNTENCAITLASASEGNVLVNVRNFGTAEAYKTVTVFDRNMALAVRDITIQPDTEKSIIFEDIYNNNAEITVSLTPEDIMPIDDTFYLAVNTAKTEKILLVTDNNTFLENALKLTEGTEVYKMTADTIESSDVSGYDLYIFDGTTPDNLPNDGNIFMINPPEDNGLVNVKGTKQLNCYSEGNSALVSGNTLSFIISEAKEVERPSWAVTESQADGTPLIISGENNGQKICIFTFDIHNSDLPLLKEFPIMIYNLTDWFLPNRSGIQTGIHCGEKLDINASADTEQIIIVNTLGEERILLPPFKDADYSDTSEPGFYSIKAEKIDGNEDKNIMAVNVKTDGESQLNAMFGQDETGNVGTVGKGGSGIMELLIITAILALVAEWWVKYRGNKH